MVLDDSDYYIAATLDAASEGLNLEAVIIACEVSDSAEDFFWAIQAGIRLKEILNDNARRH